MPDDKQQVGHDDRIRVNQHEPYEMEHLRAKHKVTNADIIACINSVGVMRADIEACLRKKKRA